jgi:hypothetical protein
VQHATRTLLMQRCGNISPQSGLQLRFRCRSLTISVSLHPISTPEAAISSTGCPECMMHIVCCMLSVACRLLHDVRCTLHQRRGAARVRVLLRAARRHGPFAARRGGHGLAAARRVRILLSAVHPSYSVPQWLFDADGRRPQSDRRTNTRSVGAIRLASLLVGKAAESVADGGDETEGTRLDGHRRCCSFMDSGVGSGATMDTTVTLDVRHYAHHSRAMAHATRGMYAACTRYAAA